MNVVGDGNPSILHVQLVIFEYWLRIPSTTLAGRFPPQIHVQSGRRTGIEKHIRYAESLSRLVLITKSSSHVHHRCDLNIWRGAAGQE